jgi:hypothetical protein
MPGRLRNTKARAQRIEREYFKGRFAIPRWRIYLSVILAGMGGAWLSWRALAHDHRVFSSGPVTPHHASFGSNCTACHVAGTPLRSKIPDRACLECHDGPVHQEQQTSTPACVNCHVEHRGVDRLVGGTDRQCASCHRELTTRNGKLNVAAHIESIAKGHPEFTPLRPGQTDPGGIKFNHKVHLRQDLKAPNGTVQLDCGDCHRPAGIVQPWRFGRADPAEPATRVGPSSFPARAATRAYMQPVNYYQHCASCHPLLFDPRSNAAVPHKKPELVESVLEPEFRKYIAAHPEELRTMPMPMPGRLPRVQASPAPRTVDDWVGLRMAEAKRLLWSKTCAECHTLSGADTLPVPKFREANLTAKWLQRGRFDHSPHQMLDCVACHKVAASEKTSDVLLPGIRTCAACHSPDATVESARSACSECHRYHDWSKERPRHGRLIGAIRPAVFGRLILMHSAA